VLATFSVHVWVIDVEEAFGAKQDRALSRLRAEANAPEDRRSWRMCKPDLAPVHPESLIWTPVTPRMLAEEKILIVESESLTLTGKRIDICQWLNGVIWDKSHTRGTSAK
jgi:hypothetical protein